MKIKFTKSLKNYFRVIFFLCLFHPVSALGDICKDREKAFLEKYGNGSYFKNKAYQLYLECLTETYDERMDEGVKKILDEADNRKKKNSTIIEPKYLLEGEPSRSTDEMKRKLIDIKVLYMDGIITEKEYEVLRRKIISSYN